MAETRYLCKAQVPCSLRAWNNFAGYTKYESVLVNHEDTLAYFLTLVPPLYSTVTIPSHYFHVLVPWINHICCEALFIVKGSHIYTMKRSKNEWIELDYPQTHTYTSVIDVSIRLQDTQYIVILFPTTHIQTFLQYVQLWTPKWTPYYIHLKQELLQAIR